MRESRDGFSKARRFSFAPVSIPEGVSIRIIGGPENESNEFNEPLSKIGKGRSRNKVRGEAESTKKFMVTGSPRLSKEMDHYEFTYAPETGIGAIVEVSKVIIVVENKRYPAGSRYVGVLETIANEILFFVSDIAVPSDLEGWTAVGRIDRKQGVLKIVDHSERENDTI